MSKSLKDDLTPHEIQLAEAILTMKANNKTYTQIADENGISRRHLQRIREKQAFRDYVKERSLQESSAKTPLVLDSLEKKAIEGNVKAIELFAKIHGLFAPDRLEVESTVTSKDKTNDDLAADLFELKDLIDESKSMH